MCCGMPYPKIICADKYRITKKEGERESPTRFCIQMNNITWQIIVIVSRWYFLEREIWILWSLCTPRTCQPDWHLVSMMIVMEKHLKMVIIDESPLWSCGIVGHCDLEYHMIDTFRDTDDWDEKYHDCAAVMNSLGANCSCCCNCCGFYCCK